MPRIFENDGPQKIGPVPGAPLRGRTLIASCTARVSALSCIDELRAASSWIEEADIKAAAEARSLERGIAMAQETETVQFLSAREQTLGVLTAECLVRSAEDPGLVYPVCLTVTHKAARLALSAPAGVAATSPP